MIITRKQKTGNGEMIGKNPLLQLTQLQQGRAFIRGSLTGNQSAGQMAKQRAGKPTPSFSLGKAHTIREPTAGT